ncbi:hypothetical protein Tco_0677603 [Tanacetum coccineum]|uniref:Ribosomal protein S10 n=1 Tax=Tanacetum coccineum TaxID=301880 RepID=A0ABQ4XCN8_9ASTR
MTPYTAYHDIQGIIYQDDMDKNRLMRKRITSPVPKDGTLNLCSHLSNIEQLGSNGITEEKIRPNNDKQRSPGVIYAVSVNIARVLKKEKKCKYKGEKKEALQHLRQNRSIPKLSETLRVFFDIEDSHGPSDAMHNPSHPLKVKKTLFQNSWRFIHFYQLSHSELVDIEKVALSSSLRITKIKVQLIKVKEPKEITINPH